MRNLIIVLFIIIPSLIYAQSIFPPTWKEKPTHSYIETHPFSDGLAHVSKSTSGKIKHGFVDKTVSTVIPFDYEDAADFKHGEAIVKKNSKWGIIDKQNQTLVGYEYDELSFLLKGVYLAKKGEQLGVINSQGKILIPFDYENIEVLSNTVLKAEKSGLLWLYNNLGHLLFADGFSRISNFTEELASVTQNKLSGFINDKGELIIPMIYERVYPFSDGLAAVKKNGKWGYINSKNELIINYEFDLGFYFSKEVALVRNRGQWGAINKSGNIIVPTKYADGDIQIVDGIIFIKGEGFIKAFDKEGATLFRREADGIREAYGDKFIFYRKISRKNKYGIVNTVGEILVDIDEFEWIKRTDKGSFIGVNGDTRTVIYEGEDGGFERLKSDFPKFEFGQISENLRIFKEKNRYGFIDETTHIAFEPNFHQVRPFTEGLAWVKMNNKWGILYHPTHPDNPNRQNLEPQKIIVKPAGDTDTKNQLTEIISLLWLTPNPDENNNQNQTTQELPIKLKAFSTTGNTNLQPEDFKIYINNQRQTTKSGEILLRGTTFNAVVNLQKGKNNIKVCIGDNCTKPLTAYYTEEKPNLHLLSIGTNPPDLEYTEKDANDFANKYQSQNQLFANVFIERLLCDNATRTKIIEQLEMFNYQYKEGHIRPNDVIMLFISSHGYIETQDNNRFRIQDSNFNPAFYKTRSVAYEEITKTLSGINCKKIIFIDACHSGGAKANAALINRYIQQLNDTYAGITTITSSNQSQKSYEHVNWKNGAFTEALLSGLSGKADSNRDSVITLGELYAYISEKVPNLVKSINKPTQEPQITRDDLGDLPIFVY